MRDLIGRLVAATSAEDVWDLHVHLMDGYGFDRLIYAASFETSENQRQNPLDLFVLSNMPEAYTERFLQDRHYLHAPVMIWEDHITPAQPWIMAASMGTIGPELRRLLSLNQQFGVQSGYSMSFGLTPPCGRATMALIAKKTVDQIALEHIWAVHGREIEVICRLVHCFLTALPRRTSRRSLTQRQSEALQMVGDGYTTQEIAAAMGLSAVTVEKHLRLARQQMGAVSSAQAVLKAAILNQAFLPDR